MDLIPANSLGRYSSENWEHPSFEVNEFFQKKHKYCICVFILNENGKIQHQLEKMKSLVDKIDIIIADGDSTDGCNDKEMLSHFSVRSLLIKKDTGKLGSQMQMAFAYALKEGYEGIITVDGNDKDDIISALPLFLQKLDDGFDHIQGSRFVPGGHHENTPLLRLLGLKILHAPLISFAAKFKYTDTTNGFRAYSKKLLTSEKTAVFRSELSGYELHYEMAISSGINKEFKVCEVPVSRIYPSNGNVPTKISGFKQNLLVFQKLCQAVIGSTKKLPPKWHSHIGKIGIFLFFTLMILMSKYSFGHYNPPTPFIDRSMIYGQGLNIYGEQSIQKFSVVGFIKVNNASNPGTEKIFLNVSGDLSDHLILLKSKSSYYNNEGLEFGVANNDGSWGRYVTLDEKILKNDQWVHFGGIINLEDGYIEIIIDGNQVGRWDIQPGGYLNNYPRQVIFGQEPDVFLKDFFIYKDILEPNQIKNLLLGNKYHYNKLGLLFLITLNFILLLFVLMIILIKTHPLTLKKDKKYQKFLLLTSAILIACLPLFYSGFYDSFYIVEKSWFNFHQKDSENLVLSSIYDKYRAENEDKNTFSEFNLGKLETEKDLYGISLKYKFENDIRIPLIPYKSQVGIQEFIVNNSFVKYFLDNYSRSDYRIYQALTAFLYAISVVLLTLLVGKLYSWKLSIGLYVGLFISQWMTLFVRNLYWMPWLWILPSIFYMAVLYFVPEDKKRNIWIFFAVSFAILLKSLCGYEYLSTLTISTAAFAFLPLRSKYAPIFETTFLMVKRFFIIFSASIFGFFIALLFHANLRSSSFINGIKDIFLNDALRHIFYGDPYAQHDSCPMCTQFTFLETIGTYLGKNSIYFQPERITRTTFIPGLDFSLFIVIFICLVFTRPRNNEAKTGTRMTENTFFLFVGLQMLAAISWFVLAKRHSVVHTHMNFVLWSLYFVPALLGWIIFRCRNLKASIP